MKKVFWIGVIGILAVLLGIALSFVTPMNNIVFDVLTIRVENNITDNTGCVALLIPQVKSDMVYKITFAKDIKTMDNVADLKYYTFETKSISRCVAFEEGRFKAFALGNIFIPFVPLGR